jgi:hypothetical protein
MLGGLHACLKGKNQSESDIKMTVTLGAQPRAAPSVGKDSSNKGRKEFAACRVSESRTCSVSELTNPYCRLHIFNSTQRILIRFKCGPIDNLESYSRYATVSRSLSICNLLVVTIELDDRLKIDRCFK